MATKKKQSPKGSWHLPAHITVSAVVAMALIIATAALIQTSETNRRLDSAVLEMKKSQDRLISCYNHDVKPCSDVLLEGNY
jgi:hypothetical protein